jgi:hypothetical protein
VAILRFALCRNYVRNRIRSDLWLKISGQSAYPWNDSHGRIVAISDFARAGGPEPGVLSNRSSLVAQLYRQP